MRPLRTAPALLRAFMAVVFGVLSVLHVPGMALAKSGAAPAPSHHRVHAQPDEPGHSAHGHRHHAGQEHHGGHHSGHHDALPAVPAAPLMCPGFDCCAAVAPPAIMAPALIPVALATLKPRPPERICAFTPERIDPPPRLHA